MINRFFSSHKIYIVFSFLILSTEQNASADFQNLFPNLEEPAPTVQKNISKQPAKKTEKQNSKDSRNSAIEDKNVTKENDKKSENSLADNDPLANHNSNAPVFFQSDTGNGSKKTGILNLVGNVKIIQDDTTLTSNKAQLLGKSGEMTLTGSKSVQKAIATGNVHIFKKATAKAQEVKATADKIEFFVPERKMILQGKAKVWKGQEFINADIMEIDLNTGDIKLKAPHGTLDPRSANAPKTKEEQKK